MKRRRGRVCLTDTAMRCDTMDAMDGVQLCSCVHGGPSNQDLTQALRDGDKSGSQAARLTAAGEWRLECVSVSE